MEKSNDEGVFLLLKTLSDNLQSLLTKLEGGGGKELAEVELEAGSFWQQLEDYSALISQDASKLSILCSGQPLPPAKDLLPVVEEMQNHHTILTTIVLSHHARATTTTHQGGAQETGEGVPQTTTDHHLLLLSYGETLCKQIHTHIKTLIQASIKLIESLVAPELRSKKKHLERTGLVWDAAQDFKTLPKSNTEAVLTGLTSSFDLITDAFAELSDSIDDNIGDKEEGDDSDDEPASSGDEGLKVKWRPENLELGQAALGLVETTRGVLLMIRKKLISLPAPASADDVEAALAKLSLEEASFLNQQLDTLPPTSSQLASLVDDLVSSFYSSIHLPSVQSQVDLLSDLLLQSLSVYRKCFAKGVMEGKEVEKVESLEKAVQKHRGKCLACVEKFPAPIIPL